MAIELTTPIIKNINVHSTQITNVSLKLYEDGANLNSCSVFVEWRKGYIENDIFVEVTRDNTTLNAQEVFTVLTQAQQATPTENLLGIETPMDKIFVSLVSLLKQKGLI